MLRNKYCLYLSFFLATLLVAACTRAPKKVFTQGEIESIMAGDKKQLLHQFVKTIHDGKFEKALEFLPEEERSALLNSNNQMPDTKKSMLGSLELDELLEAGSIRVKSGKIHGLSDYLETGTTNDT